MNSREFKKLYEYVNTDSQVYIITKGQKINPVTDVRKLILAEIDKLSPDCYLKLNVNITKKGWVQMNSVRTNKSFNSYCINIQKLNPILDKLNLNLNELIKSKDIFIKKKSSIDSSLERKLKIKEKNESRVSVISKRPIDDKFKKWIKSTMNELSKNVTESENIVFRKLQSAFGKRVKRQKPFVINGKSYFADIYIKSMKLIIEVDGGYHKLLEQKEKDEIRDKSFESIGYKTIRVTNEQAHDKEFMKGFIQKIKELKNGKLKIN